jgi:hypothetical protein
MLYLTERFSASQALADSSIPAMAAKACDHQITNTAESLKGFPLPAKCRSESDQFGERSRNESRF